MSTRWLSSRGKGGRPHALRSHNARVAGFEPGTLLAGRYRLRRLLGRGGMGVVYEAHDEALDIAIAVKLIRPEELDGPSRVRFQQLFKQELLTARQVTHRNVLRIHDIGETDGVPFITMPYVDGPSLSAGLAQRRLTWEEIASIATQLCAGLSAAHEAGVIHRDLKPQNVLLDSAGSVYVSDFGLATWVTTASLTRTGGLFGTPAYLAPEQIEGRPADRRSDIYALGLILYEMACGRQPFEDSSSLAALLRRTRETPPPPDAVDSSVLGFYSRIVMRCLEREPEIRYQRAADVLEDLRREQPPAPALDVGHTAGHTPGARPAAVRDRPPGAPTPTRLMILPFRLLRPDVDTEFLAFSVPDAVVHALSGLRSLTVRSSGVASRFGTEQFDFKQLAAEADVDAVVTGTLLRSGAEIRLSAQLLAVPDGTVLWSQTLQVALTELFELQDRLVADIVRSLSLSLTAGEQRRLARDVPRSAAAYDFFLRGNEAVGPQGIGSSSNLRVARELYSRAVEEDPQFAPAWARLGRCVYLIGKADSIGESEVQRSSTLVHAETCFQRALELSPDLPLAHYVYALFEIDQGRAVRAMVRLIARGLAGSAQPELYAALVQACRYCGLLEPSIAAHFRARALDPAIPTGGYQSLWHLGEDDRALREGIRPFFLTAIFTGMRGDRARALQLLGEIEARGPTTLLRHMVAAMKAVFEEQHDRAVENAVPIFDAPNPDPESLYFVGRTLAYFGDRRALTEFARALDLGFVVYRVLLKKDPWLDPLRGTTEFRDLLERSREVYRQCRAAYLDAGGEPLLGAVPTPEALESGR